MTKFLVFFPAEANVNYGVSYFGFERKEYKFNTIKEYFQYKGNNFNSDLLTLEEINKLIVDGFVIFPINATKFTEIETYSIYAFKPCFMKAKDFAQFKKELMV